MKLLDALRAYQFEAKVVVHLFGPKWNASNHFNKIFTCSINCDRLSKVLQTQLHWPLIRIIHIYRDCFVYSIFYRSGYATFATLKHIFFAEFFFCFLVYPPEKKNTTKQPHEYQITSIVSAMHVCVLFFIYFIRFNSLKFVSLLFCDWDCFCKHKHVFVCSFLSIRKL